MKNNIHDLDCPTCDGSMIKSYAEETKFRLKLLKWDRRGMFAVCKGCSTEVKVDVDLIKSIQSRFEYEVDTDSESRVSISD